MARQLPLDLPARPAHGRDDFLVSPANALALARIDTPSGWRSGKLALIGPEGSGKTHLVHVWAAETGARIVTARDAATLTPATLDTALAVDSMDTGLSNAAETALFHAHNALAAAGLPLLMTGRDGPARWPIRLPDLASRVAAADVARIEPPDDALLHAVLVKLFADRQLAPAPKVMDYLLTHMDRSFAAARALVARLDAAALAERRAVTIPLARKVLETGDN